MATEDVEELKSARPTSPWTRPTKVELDAIRGRVRATYLAVEGEVQPHAVGALRRFLRIAAGKTEHTKQQRTIDFVRRYGLIDSPFSRHEGRFPDYEGLDSIHEERLSDYLELSELLNSTIVVNKAFQEGGRLPSGDVARLLAFIEEHAMVSVSLRRLESLDRETRRSLRSRVEEPMMHEFPGVRGDVRRIWRELQAERVVEVFNLWVSKGRVSPILVREGKILRGDVWTGAAWGALAGELQGVLTGRSLFGVCAFCNRAYEGKHKRPREIYAEKPVSLCCGDPDCLRAKRRTQTAESRAKSRRTTRARARTRVLVS